MNKTQNKQKLTKSQIEAVAFVRDLQLKLNSEQKKCLYWSRKANALELLVNDLQSKIDNLTKKRGGKNA